jgi:hypothetical protein
MTHQEIIDLIFKFTSMFVTAAALMFGIYKFSMRNLDKKFEEQYQKLKLNFDAIFIEHIARLNWIQQELSRLNNLLGMLVAEQKINNEDIARLKAEVMSIQLACKKQHFWDGQPRRVTDVKAE